MSDSFDLDLDAPMQPAPQDAYRVLARKYRPQTFSELIGQEAMVQTLANAIQRDRLAHAFLLTGIRGTGKTSTARLIAKALNCIGPDGQGGPTIDPCGVCEPCRAIAEGRHIDVIEMDAASHTGIDDIREIIEASRYSAVSARYKIYIIDEVHMLSKAAFNGLLKTLEEPPAHVKFLFATTEVNKVPVTVLSRCQRFDLRRIPAEALAAHFAFVSQAEGVEAEPEALGMIARAAEGSARDGLSILDQAIAHAGIEGGGVRADAVREMLGLSDRGAIRELFAALTGADARGALGVLRRQYDLGVDPQAVLRTLLETVHGITLAKLGNPAPSGQPAEERTAFVEWAGKLSFPVLHRFWQLLLKGHEEVAKAVLPIEACEMAVLRVIHASALPDPGELARQLADGAPSPQRSAAPSAPAPAPSAPEPALPMDVVQLVALLENNSEHLLAVHAAAHLRPILFAPPAIEASTVKPLPADFLRDLGAALRRITGKTWNITTSASPGAPSLKDAREASDRSRDEEIRAAPVVAAILDAFPDAEPSWSTAS